MPVGEIIALWRYPVKSMQGEEVDRAIVTERGLLGDRAYAVLDRETGYIASAKYPRKWNRLIECQAEFEAPPQPDAPLPPVRITLPTGDIIHSAQRDADQALSRFLGRAVSIVMEAPTSPIREADRTPIDASSAGEIIRQEQMALAAPAGTFFDYAPLHILTTATINRLRERYPSGQFNISRFRPNIVIAPLGDESGFVENQWLGKRLQAGDKVQLQGIYPCPRCVVTTLAQGNLPRDVGILHTVAQNNSAESVTLAPGVLLPAVAGIYATVLHRGVISRRDTVRLFAIDNMDA